MALCGKTSSGVVLLALVYLAYNLYHVYTIFNPPACAPNQIQNCIKPAHPKDVELQLWVYLSTIKSTFSSRAKLLYHNNSFYRTDEIKTTLQVDIPSSVHKKNGTYYAHVFLGPQGLTPDVYEERYHLSYSVVPLTKHSVPTSTAFNLLSESKEDNSTPSVDSVTHWVPFLHIHSLAEDWRFDSHKVPHEIWDYLRVGRTLHLTQGIDDALPIQVTMMLYPIGVFEGPLRYLPPLYVDRLKVTKKQLKPIEANMTLDLLYAPVSIGKFRLWLIFASTLDNMGALGFKEKEFDDLKGIFLETNFWLFGLTIFISVFHLLFDFLAFKNDISFWRKHKTMVGLSLRTIMWRCFSQLIVFLYLMDQKSSLLILIPTGIGSVIEFWKVSKALKITVTWSGIIPKFKLGEKGEDEKMSESYDSEVMNKLFYVLAPLVVLGAAYQLVSASFTSWYSWVIQSLVNGVYAFGFLFMLPQLFLNYKLKSVAHLPWKAFMYKAFNTFIDDVFAFIITMPTAHRLAVFRDDIVFLIYLYQRWLYPVDKTRTNEFGQSFDSEDKKVVEDKKPKHKSKRRVVKHKRKVQSDGEDEATGDKSKVISGRKVVHKGPSNSGSKDDAELRVSDSDEGPSDDITRSYSGTAEDDSDSEGENRLNTKELICDTTSEEAKVGAEGGILQSGSGVHEKLKSD